MCNAVPHEAPDVTRIPAIKEQFLELAGVMDLKLFVSGWFHDAPFEVPLARPRPPWLLYLTWAVFNASQFRESLLAQGASSPCLLRGWCPRFAPLKPGWPLNRLLVLPPEPAVDPVSLSAILVRNSVVGAL